jgi:uncharacterized protein (DUF952 family)
MRPFIYHIISQSEWKSALSSGHYQPPSLAAEGFIHCSTRAQVLATAGRYYRGQEGLLLLCIDPSLVSSQICFEDTSNNGDLFPHIYGALPVEAAATVVDFPTRADGLFDWPAGATME